ncbi:branched-chain amino acid ABC transporter permease, partial [Pantoea allii]
MLFPQMQLLDKGVIKAIFLVCLADGIV